MNKIKHILLVIIIFFLNNSLKSAEIDLLSYQSVYEITLDKNREMKNTFGQTTIKEANGELLLDWFNNCDSWSSNQRMYLSFLNSSGVGSVSDINYSLTEKNDSSEMNFALQVKENNILVQRVNGIAKRKNDLKIQLFNPKEKNLTFKKNVLFPHQHLKKIIEILGTEKKIFSEKVYEGSIPDNYLDISTFINQESVKEDSKKFSKEIQNKFWVVRMAYYKDNNQVPEMELTAKINNQGVVSYFKYDYPTYSLIMNLKKIQISPIKKCQ